MELMMGMGGKNSSFIQIYQYHKLGCPIAWISGALNRFSLFRITLNKDTCLSCGKCDTACYMPVLEKKRFSLYKTSFEKPGDVRLFQNSGSFEKATLDVHAVFLLFFII
jgi:hypothetical protein